MIRTHGGPWWALVRFGFRLLYNELAFTYDAVSYIVSLGAWRCWQRSALAYIGSPDKGPVLELAHGTGNLQFDLHGQGYTSVGLDLSPYMGRLATNKLRRQKIVPRLIRGRAQYLPFPSASFAVVLSTFPTEFMFDVRTLDEVYRVLRSDGRLVIVPVGILSGRSTAEAAIEWLYRITGQRGGGPTDVSAFFARYGFDAELHQVSCPRSVAQVIVARKKV